MTWFFVSDLHGRPERYTALFAAVRDERPEAVLIGGDFTPPGLVSDGGFVDSLLGRELSLLRAALGLSFPRVLLIFGNDDRRSTLPLVEEIEREGLVEILHQRWVTIGGRRVAGYPYVPPTPFRLKDWERYDVGRYVEPGCLSPEEGAHTVAVDPVTTKFATIKADLEHLTSEMEVAGSIWLFHAPPYRTNLDRAALDGKTVDHAPLDVNVGSIAIRRFIEEKQPCLTMHGHIHESARLSGSWRDRIGETHLLGAAHDGPELALVRFDPADPSSARRELIG
jgi:Icc-related predicted phosphoesterase